MTESQRPTAIRQFILEELGSDDLLLYSSDYPHWHYDGDDAVPSVMPPDLLRKILVDNPLATYPRLAP